MLADTSLLLRLYWTLDRRADGGTRLAARVALLAVGIFIMLLSVGVGFVAASLTQDTSPIQVRAGVLPGLLLTTALIGVVVVGFSQALQALYLSDDLDKLLTAPVHTSAVMTAKLLSRMPATVVVLLVATIPALIAFGVRMGMGPLYYVTGVALLLAAPLFGISAGALAAILLVRFLPARRLNEWVGAASIIVGVLIWMLIYIPTLLRDNDQPLDAQTLATVETAINQFGDLPLPSVWAGEALVELGRSQIVASTLGSVSLYLLITVGLFLFTILLMNRLYLSGWLRMQSSASMRQNIGDRPGVFGRTSVDFILGYKDWLLRIRDARMLATMFTSVVMALVVMFPLLRGGGPGESLLTVSGELADEIGSGDAANPISAGVLIPGLLYFSGWVAFSRLALTSLSIERGSFYILKAAPVPPAQVLRAKTLGVYAPYAAYVSIGLAAALFTMRFSLAWTPYAWLVLLILGYGLYSFLVSLGILYPRLDWDDPRRMSNRRTGLPALIGTVAYSIIGLAVALAVYVAAFEWPALAFPLAVLGLALLAGGTWLFVHWRTVRVERAWPGIGVE